MNQSLQLTATPFDQLSGLIRLQGLKQEMALQLDRPIRIGRDDLDSPYVNVEHAEVRLTQDGVQIRDLDSKNGTRVEGHRVDGGWADWPLGAAAQIANCPVRLSVSASEIPVTAPRGPCIDHTALLAAAQQAMINQPAMRICPEWFQSNADDQLSSDEARELMSLLNGLGPLESLLKDPEVSEIMVLGDRPIWIERCGQIEQTSLRFPNHEWLLRVIERVLRPLGREISQASPLCDGRLPDGSRVNAVLPPISLDGPALTIRKFQSHVHSLQSWVDQDSIPDNWAAWLADSVAAGRDILVVGGTGAGKTTLLNALAQSIPESSRVVSIEDAAELDLKHEHWIRLETRQDGHHKAGLDGRALLINALRMRPDRLILGEVRGPEALELIQALNTGHRGCMSTLHANSATAAARRLEMLLMLSGLDWPLEAVREQIAQGLDLVVSVGRTPGGKRQVEGIYELVGLDDQGYQWECHYRV